MKKLVLTIAIAMGMTIASNAQRFGADYDFSGSESADPYASRSYGEKHSVNSYGDYHYVGAFNYNADENNDYLTGVGRLSSISYDNYGEKMRGGLFSGTRGGVLPNLPGHGQSDNQDAPIGGGALLLIGFGAAYALTKKK